MINDDIEFLPQDSFFVCMGDDGKPVYGVVNPHDHYKEFRAIIEYKGKRWMAQTDDKVQTAFFAKQIFLSKHPELADPVQNQMLLIADTLFEKKLHQLTYQFSPTPPSPAELVLRPYDWRDEYKLRPIEVNLRVVAEKQIEGGAVVESKCYRLTAYKQSKESGVQFYAKELK